jgi:magnesium-transporting ATPase (P-type)
MNEQTDTLARPRPDAWHAIEPSEVLEKIGSTVQGLETREAAARLERHGPNELQGPERESLLRRFLRQFHNALIYVLLAAASLTAFLQEWVDTGVILGVVVINALIGFIQEGKAEAAMESIREMLSPRAVVVRGGEKRSIDAAELVPGDVVVLESGDRVPADARVLEAVNVQVQEAALTGESASVPKSPRPVDEEALLGDRASMLFSGTIVTSGRAKAVVVATGQQTEIGRIGVMLSEVTELKTPLLRSVDRFGRTLSAAIVALTAAVFAFGYFTSSLPLSELFLAVVSLAVAAIPEGLPAIMTITLALGVQRMARHNAIVRRLPSVETLGSVTVICTDKTGTLTRNEMTVRRVAAGGRIYSVTGSGYRPEGRFHLEDRPVSPAEHPALMELLRGALPAANARLHQDRESGEWRLQGEPTEGALIVLAAKAGLWAPEAAKERPRLDEMPFESERRFAASLNREPGGGARIYVNGAPEKILSLSQRQSSDDGEEELDRPYWQRVEQELAAGGHRVLAVAARRAPPDGRLHPGDLEGGFTLLGLVGVMDPPREEAKAAIRECLSAGINVKMITGDHALTAASIGEQMGIGNGRRAVTGRELEAAGDEQLVSLVRDHDIFARTSPEHKLRIVEALQRSGQVVAMTGDGVNDAPALKRANIGVAMGIKGTEATKEAAAMVLADDNFATIERAVREGRTIYDNLKKTIMFLLPTNIGEALVIIVAILFLFDVLPLTPVQVLWINMVTAVTLALALAFEPAEAGIMDRPPRPVDEPIITRRMLWRILSITVVLAAGALFQFGRLYSAGESVELARTVAVNTLAAGEAFYLFNCRSMRSSSLSLSGLAGNRYALLAFGLLALFQLAFTYLPVFHTLFGTQPLESGHWLSVVAFGAGLYLLVEFDKYILRRRSRAAAAEAEADL